MNCGPYVIPRWSPIQKLTVANRAAKLITRRDVTQRCPNALRGIHDDPDPGHAVLDVGKHMFFAHATAVFPSKSTLARFKKRRFVPIEEYALTVFIKFSIHLMKDDS